MDPAVRKLTLSYLQALIGVKRLQSYHLIDKFESSATSTQKTRYAFQFGALNHEVEQLEMLLYIAEYQSANFECLTIS